MSMFAEGRLSAALVPGVQLLVTMSLVRLASASDSVQETAAMAVILALSCYSTALSFLNAAASLPDNNRTPDQEK